MCWRKAQLGQQIWHMKWSFLPWIGWHTWGWIWFWPPLVDDIPEVFLVNASLLKDRVNVYAKDICDRGYGGDLLRVDLKPRPKQVQTITSILARHSEQPAMHVKK